MFSNYVVLPTYCLPLCLNSYFANSNQVFQCLSEKRLPSDHQAVKLWFVLLLEMYLIWLGSDRVLGHFASLEPYPLIEFGRGQLYSAVVLVCLHKVQWSYLRRFPISMSRHNHVSEPLSFLLPLGLVVAQPWGVLSAQTRVCLNTTLNHSMITRALL